MISIEIYEHVPFAQWLWRLLFPSSVLLENIKNHYRHCSTLLLLKYQLFPNSPH